MNKKVLIAVVVLLVIVAVTAYLNRGDLALKKEMQDNAIVSLKVGDEQIQMDMKQILKLNVEDFDATIKSSGKDPRPVIYRGVALKDIFAAVNLDISDKSKVIVKAVDGYTVALNVKEVLDDENVYLVFEKDGKSLGKKEDGGSGPYQVIIRKDAFSQRWCKFVSAVEAK
ncbi:MAG: hypothetical protein KAX49_15465 [Halanaerobiales bacterium]|nr:hypothetical protein [Halanaerobiales bacterium]